MCVSRKFVFIPKNKNEKEKGGMSDRMSYRSFCVEEKLDGLGFSVVYWLFSWKVAGSKTLKIKLLIFRGFEL